MKGLEGDLQLGASFMVMTLLGGALLTGLMGLLSDIGGIHCAFTVPLAGFVYLTWFGLVGSQASR